jgi:ATP-dependent exoDNAse (exonuclease V) beta subunit
MAAHPAMTRRLVQEAKLLLQRFIGSDLHKSILSAKQILHELPYYKVSDTKSTTSRPDLLIETNDSNWLIVDYKTDRFPADAMAAQAKTHAKQLEQYRQDLSDIAGIQANKSIYFARHGVLYHFND